MVGVLSPFGAVAVAILGLGVALWLVTTEAVDHGSGSAKGGGWLRRVGWALMGLVAVVLVLAVPTSSDTVPRPDLGGHPGAAGSPPALGAAPAGPAGPD